MGSKVRFTTASPDAVRTAAVKPGVYQLLEALLGLQERVRILRIEIVPGLASSIHHDLCGLGSSVAGYPNSKPGFG